MFDTIVVGAGIAGLTAAHRLKTAGQNVLVLEARDRVGGRTHSGTFTSGTNIELGGQWVGPTQDAALKLISDLGLTTFTVYNEGVDMLCAGGTKTTSADGYFGLTPEAAQAFQDLVALIDECASRLDLTTPWTHPEAVALDRITAREWVTRHCDNQQAVAFAHTMLTSIFAAETDEYSALHMLFYLGSGGGLHRMMITIGGAQDSRVLGGTHQLSERLADRIDTVFLNEKVTGIVGWDGDGPVEVHTQEVIYCAKHVIVTLPPTLVAGLHFDPPLPSSRDVLFRGIQPGNVIKFQVEYDGPFWREAGLSGTVLSLDHNVSLVYDNCVPTSDNGILVAFVEGRHARTLGELDPHQQHRLVTHDLMAFFGEQAANPVEVLSINWSDEPYTRGCYGGRLSTGLWTTVGKHLAELCGRVHFAGAETASTWNGYIDGAIRSGYRSAEEVIAARG